MEQEKIITFETAKLAKEKGFFIDNFINIYPLVDFYNDYKKGELTCIFDEQFNIDIAFKNNYYAEAPTQAYLQKWLREKHNIEVEVYRTHECVTGEKYGCEGENWNAQTEEEFDLFNFYNKTYEGALEMGLYEALKLI